MKRGGGGGRTSRGEWEGWEVMESGKDVLKNESVGEGKDMLARGGRGERRKGK